MEGGDLSIDGAGSLSKKTLGRSSPSLFRFIANEASEPLLQIN